MAYANETQCITSMYVAIWPSANAGNAVPIVPSCETTQQTQSSGVLQHHVRDGDDSMTNPPTIAGPGRAGTGTPELARQNLKNRLALSPRVPYPIAFAAGATALATITGGPHANSTEVELAAGRQARIMSTVTKPT